MVDLDRQKLTAYLLGSLGPNETEQFDERSFSDDAFVAALNAAETELIDSYVSGELSSADRLNFERLYGGSEQAQSRLAFAGAFAEFGRSQISKNDLSSSDTTSVELRDSLWSRLFSTGNWSSWRLGYSTWAFGGVAAAVIILALGVWVLVSRIGSNGLIANSTPATANIRPGTNGSEPEEAAVQPVTEQTERDIKQLENEKDRLDREVERAGDRARDDIIREDKKRSGQQPQLETAPRLLTLVLNPQMRGVGDLPNLKVSSNNDRVQVRLELEPNDFESYRIELRESGRSAVIWRSAKDSVTQDAGSDALSLSLPVRILKGKILTFTVTGVAPDRDAEILGDYTFRVVR